MIPPNARMVERHFPDYYASREFDEFPHISNITHLWCNNWYDGELEGVAEANGEKLYYFFHDDRDNGRIFLLFRLSSEQWEHETLKHDQEEKPYVAAGYYDAEERAYTFTEAQIAGYCTDCDW